MNYILEYLDKTTKVTIPIQADTTEKARRKAAQILQGKKYTDPGLYEEEGLFESNENKRTHTPETA